MALKCVESFVGADLEVIKQEASKLLRVANFDVQGKSNI